MTPTPPDLIDRKIAAALRADAAPIGRIAARVGLSQTPPAGRASGSSRPRAC